MLTTYDSDADILPAIEAGAAGYLLKDTAFEELVKAIRVVCAGKKYLSPDITDIVLQDYLHPAAATDGQPAILLTTREREVLQLIVEGCATRVVANRLNISIKTVEKHRSNLMAKLKLRGAAELAKLMDKLQSVQTIGQFLRQVRKACFQFVSIGRLAGLQLH